MIEHLHLHRIKTIDLSQAGRYNDIGVYHQEIILTDTEGRVLRLTAFNHEAPPMIVYPPIDDEEIETPEFAKRQAG